MTDAKSAAPKVMMTIHLLLLTHFPAHLFYTAYNLPEANFLHTLDIITLGNSSAGSAKINIGSQSRISSIHLEHLMPAHTLGLLAPNGNVAIPTVDALLNHEAQGKIKLVLLHRPGGPLKVNLPSSVEVREMDLEGEKSPIE